MADTTITDIQCRTVFDSRGVETLEVDVGRGEEDMFVDLGLV
jgi:enolase